MGKYNIWGERIKLARQKKGLSQVELARQLNCTQAALSQYERGTRDPSLGDITNMANILGTSTDYLLGRTEIHCNNTSVKAIGEYLGLNEESISQLHTMYLAKKRKTDEEYIIDDLKTCTNTIPSDEEYTRYYNYIKKDYLQSLSDYQKALNEFICSRSFTVLIRNLTNNLFLERIVYDLLHVIEKQYDKIQTQFPCDNPAEQAYALTEMGEDSLKSYSLNTFDIQTAILEFCQNFTKLDTVKNSEQDNQLFRFIVFSVYSATHPMFEQKEYSVDQMEKELAYLHEKYQVQIQQLLKNT